MCISHFSARYGCRAEGGLTLIELIMFIVIVGVAVTGVLSVLNITARSSADPMVRKQMLAIGEALLEEVQMMPFTFCDPTDANAATATSAAVGAGPTFCATTVEDMGPEAGETRTGAVTPFNNVNDYNGTVLASPIGDITGFTTAPAGYSAAIAITAEALNGVAAGEALRIAVTVTQGNDTLVVEGYRTRYAPNGLP